LIFFFFFFLRLSPSICARSQSHQKETKQRPFRVVSPCSLPPAAYRQWYGCVLSGSGSAGAGEGSSIISDHLRLCRGVCQCVSAVTVQVSLCLTRRFRPLFSQAPGNPRAGTPTSTSAHRNLRNFQIGIIYWHHCIHLGSPLIAVPPELAGIVT
jgi:hypothetical protein